MKQECTGTAPPGETQGEHCRGCVWDADYSRQGIRPPRLVACHYCGEVLYRPGDKPDGKKA